MQSLMPPINSSDNLFHNGNPLTGEQGTIVTADFLNNIQSAMRDAQQELTSVLSAAGIATDPTSHIQLLKAIQLILSPGRLLNIQIFTANGLYTPTTGTKSVIVEATGAGGGSAGVPATSSTQSGISAAGSSGSFARARYLSDFAGLQVTVGSGGTPGTSTVAGGDGGASKFGNLLTCPGGKGSGVGLVSANQVVAVAPTQSASPTGTNIIRASAGAPVNNAIQAAFGIAAGWNPSAAGDGFFADGLGGSGVYQAASKAAVNGNPGTRGVVVILEYA